MLTELRQYLDSIRRQSRLDPQAEKPIIRELMTHLEDRIGELREAGFSLDEAARIATERFGSAKTLARELYQTYSNGSYALLSLLSSYRTLDYRPSAPDVGIVVTSTL